MVGRIVAAVDLPVTMDLEAGYGDAGETARRAIEVGVVGGNLEDQMKPLDEAVAAVEAVLARRPGRRHRLRPQRAHRRLRPCPAAAPTAARCWRRRSAAGGRSSRPAPRSCSCRASIARDEIVALVDALGPQKLSVIAVPKHSLPVRELQELGVARVSTGPFTQRVALTALQDATAELRGRRRPPRGHPLAELTASRELPAGVPRGPSSGPEALRHDFT